MLAMKIPQTIDVDKICRSDLWERLDSLQVVHSALNDQLKQNLFINTT